MRMSWFTKAIFSYESILCPTRPMLPLRKRSSISPAPRWNPSGGSCSAQRSNAEIASEQIRRAQTNLELSMRTEERLQPLTAKGYVPKQQLDQAEVARQNATSSLTEAKEQETAAHHLVDDVAAAEAAVRAAAAALTNARRALEDTEVRAPHEGRIVGLSVSTGEMVIPSQSLFTLINTEEWFVSANFREIDLKRVKQGDCVTVYSMIDRHTPMKGIVDSIGFGVLSEDRINVPVGPLSSHPSTGCA
jgi:multidrug efflux system membrane fusion protein